MKKYNWQRLHVWLVRICRCLVKFLPALTLHANSISHSRRAESAPVRAMRRLRLREAITMSASKRQSIKPPAGAGKVVLLPQPKCTCVTELRQGEKCPVCGTEAQSDDYQDSRSSARSRADGEGMLFTDATTDEELMKKIHLGLEHLSSLDKANAVFEQNRVILLQNELILRKLRK